MDDTSEYEILCTASGYILRAFSAPAPTVSENEDLPPMYYLSIGAFYMALCDGSQIFMTAFIDSSVRLYHKIGKRFRAISRSAVSQSKLTLNDLYITYDQCITVMLHFFVQIAHMMDPTINIEDIMRQKRDDTCMMETIQWIQNLEAAIKLTTSRLSVRDTAMESDRIKHIFVKGYSAATLPFVYMLFKEHALHTTLRRSNHPLGQRRLLPMIAIVIEGYMVYSSSRMNSYNDCRSISLQNEILLRLNLSITQQAEANANNLILEELQAEDRAKRKAEKKRAKRLRKKQKKEASIRVIDNIVGSTEVELDDGTDSDLDSVEILMDEFPEFSIIRRRLKASCLSPYANPFIPH